MKRRRPSKHYRSIKTKKGRKKVLINKNIKKPRPVIRPFERKFFKQISNHNNFNKEIGGAIDFDKTGKIEQITVLPGTATSVDIPEDFEVQYHTHPFPFPNPPSPEDVLALLKNNKQQAEIVFRNGQAFIITKTKSTKALSKLPATQLHKKLVKAFNSIPIYNWEQGWKNKLERLGFKVQIKPYKPNEYIKLNIKPKEPKRTVEEL